MAELLHERREDSRKDVSNGGASYVGGGDEVHMGMVKGNVSLGVLAHLPAIWQIGSPAAGRHRQCQRSKPIRISPKLTRTDLEFGSSG